MNEITTVEGWEACLSASETAPIFVFKHSTRCPISTAAYSAVARHVASAGESGPRFHLVKVIESRTVSNAVAETLGVEHKSPQLILVKERKAVWEASHYGINGERIEEAVKLHG